MMKRNGVGGLINFEQLVGASEDRRCRRRTSPDATPAGGAVGRLTRWGPAEGDWDWSTSACERWTVAGDGRLANVDEFNARPQPSATSPGSLAAAAVSLLQAEGLNGLARLRGAFALAIWDAHHRRLHLVRDVFGRRSLYWARRGQRVGFASRWPLLNEWGLIGDVTPRGAVAFLTLGFCPPSISLLENLQVVPPGGKVTIADGYTSVDDGFLKLPRLPEAPADKAHRRVHRALDTALERVASDQPRALAFSGGIDSTILLVHMIGLSLPVETYTVVSPGGPPDENCARARRLAKHFGTRHVEIPFELPGVEDAATICARRIDTPAGFPVVLHNDALHRVVGKHRQSVLAGHGADEVLGGYGRHRDALAWQPISSSSALPLAPDFKRWRRMRQLRWWRRFAAQMLHGDLLQAAGAADWTPTIEVTLLGAPSHQPVDHCQWLDLVFFGQWDNFTLPEENGRAHDLEVRSPFFDLDLVASSFALAPQARLAGSTKKRVLRERLRGYVPDDLIDAHKVGFDSSFDYRRWVMDNYRALLDIADSAGELDWLSQSARKRLLNDRFWRRHQWELIWRLFALACWSVGLDRRPRQRS